MDEEQRKKLLKKFFYFPLKKDLNEQNLIFMKKPNNFFNLEDINILCNKVNNDKKELSKIKIKSLRAMIINQNKIPQKWIQKENYKIMLNKVIKPNYVKYAQNYIEHTDKNKKKEDLLIIKRMAEVKTPKFTTINHYQNKNIKKENSTKVIYKNSFNLRDKYGKSLNKILSYQRLNSEDEKFVNKNKYLNKNEIIHNIHVKNKIRSFPTESNLIKKPILKEQNSKIHCINIKGNNLSKNFKSIDNISSRKTNKLTLPRINTNIF